MGNFARAGCDLSRVVLGVAAGGSVSVKQRLEDASGPAFGVPRVCPLTLVLHGTFASQLLERAKGFEPSTPTLARSCSTPELHPHPMAARYARQARSYAKRHLALQQCPLKRAISTLTTLTQCLPLLTNCSPISIAWRSRIRTIQHPAAVHGRAVAGAARTNSRRAHQEPVPEGQERRLVPGDRAGGCRDRTEDRCTTALAPRAGFHSGPPI